MAVQSLADRFGVHLSAGTTVFRQGDPGGSIYVIRAGRVRVVKEAHGRRRIVSTLGPGDFFGEMAAVTGKPRSATVEVIEDADLLRVPAEKLQEMVVGAGEVAIRLIRHLAERLESANRFIDVLLEDDVTARVILELQDSLQRSEGAAAPDITATDLALKLGTEKSEVQPALRRLSRVGITEVSGGFILVKQPERLGEFLDFIRSSGKK
ncbi:MAG TPA: Crp/Fnr family transcriptional regulator [Polyangiales bacterium]|jgi:CRP-like cAMP-binding protein|nr:Crp/Fnr family transcriptional regulator [Polyangiales bacterium]